MKISRCSKSEFRDLDLATDQAGEGCIQKERSVNGVFADVLDKFATQSKMPLHST